MAAELLQGEIRSLLIEHAGQPMDRVALFMFLNTVPGGHYVERYGEAELAEALGSMLEAGQIEAQQEDQDGLTLYRLPGSGSSLRTL